MSLFRFLLLFISICGSIITPVTVFVNENYWALPKKGKLMVFPFGVPTLIIREHKTRHIRDGFFYIGGGHGTRTHGAVTPYLISNQAP